MDIQSKEVIDKIAEDLKVQPSLDIPRTLSKDIQLTYDCNPRRSVKLAAATCADATTTTAFTSSSTRRTFITGILLTATKSALSTSIISQVNGTPKGGAANYSFCALRYEPLTAGSFNTFVSFPVPLEIEKGSAVNVTNSTAVASIDTSAIIQYYEEDPL